ncbi:MAG: outer membrane beta-barrel protein [Pseudomonadota bacterium]
MGARATKTWLAAAAGGAMLALAATPSQAQGPWYASVTGNAVWVSDSDWNSSGGPNGTFEYDTGWGIDGALGYSLSGSMQGVRVEGEVGYRSNDIDKVNVNNFGLVPGGTGDIDVWTGLINGYYDIDLGSNIMPYVGAGLGIAHVDGQVIVPGPGGRISDSETVFAYQFSAGLGYAVSPSTTLFAGYRYLATDDIDFSGGGTTVSSEYHSHNAQAGVRFSF